MNLSPLPVQKFFGNDGKPLVGGLLFTYEAGTSIKVATYIDSSGTTQNTNPVVLDFRGECRLWIDPTQAYKFVLSPAGDTDPPTRPIWTVDDITAGPAQQENAADDTGSVNNVELSIAQISAPVAFTRIVFKAANTNTGPVTISINGGTARMLTWQNIGTLSGGEVQAGGLYEAIFDGARWQLQSPSLLPFEMRTAAEIAVGAVVTNYSIPSHEMAGAVYPARYGLAASNTSINQTAILNTAYAVAKATKAALVLPPSDGIRFSSTLVWDGFVSVSGASRRGTVLLKDTTAGDFIAITITSGGPGCEFSNFRLTTLGSSGGVPPPPGAGHGIVMGVDNQVSLHDIDIFYQSGNGLFLDNNTSTGNFNHYANIGTLYNGVDGVRVNNHSSSRWDNINSFGNRGWGFNIPTDGSANSFHTGTMLVCQGCTAGGANIASQNNVMQFYGEGNTGPDIVLTATSYQNLITNYHTDVVADLVDLGTRNMVIDVSAAGVGGMLTERVSRPKRTTNVSGADVFVVGGAAGDGGSPFSGGNAYLYGGPAAGTGAADGGAAIVTGGDPTGAGRQGLVQLQPFGGGVLVAANSSLTTESAALEIKSTTKAMLFSRMTETQRDALVSPQDAMVIYNTDTGKLQVRAGGSWVNLH